MDYKKSKRDSIKEIFSFFVGCCVVFALLFTFPFSIDALVVADQGTVSITATVVDPNAVVVNPPSSGGGGGGGGASPSATQNNFGGNDVVFKGLAYPGSIVTILRDGVVVAEVPASPDATFQVTVGNVSAGIYNFGVRAQDQNGIISQMQVYTITLTSGVTTQIQGIILAPTIDIDMDQVKQGDIVTIFGRTIPKAEVTLIVNSENNLIKKTSSDNSGVWVYKLDTLELEHGDHQVKAKGVSNEDTTPYSQSLAFKVGTVTTKKTTTSKTTQNTVSSGITNHDLSSDGRINLVDFSILAYWYGRSNPPKIADMNHDGKITLVDFSIMAYYWTG